jgi:hypothetical protein
MKRVMMWSKTGSGKVVACTDCSWWAAVTEEDTARIIKEFEAHICELNPPLKTEKPSPK